MKRHLTGLILFISFAAIAQAPVSVSVGSSPSWGPAGYHERYYYLPDVEAYYDTQSSVFIYQGKRKWVKSNYLPRRFRTYDLYKGHKVVMTDYRGETPYDTFKEYKRRYKIGYNDWAHTVH